MNIKIEKIEYYLPAKKETREDLVRDNPDWRMDSIEQKTGIINRYVVDDESALDLAVQAANKLKLNGNEIDGIIYVTQSPEYVLPTTACVLQEKLNLSVNCMAFDVNLGCSGFVYGLGIAASLVQSSLVTNALLVCSDTYTKYISKSNRTCRPIFSDGASATLISACESTSVGPFVFKTDGSGAESLVVKKNDINNKASALEDLYMDGSRVFMFTMSEVPKAINEVLNKGDMTLNDIDVFIFHQASKLVIDNLIRKLKLSEEKVYRNYSNIGNTVSSTIPIALNNAVDEDLIKPGSRVLLAGFGVGLSIGVTVLMW